MSADFHGGLKSNEGGQRAAGPEEIQVKKEAKIQQGMQ